MEKQPKKEQADSKKIYPRKKCLHEMLIHQFLFETYYFGEERVRNELLPPEYHGKKINLILLDRKILGDTSGLKPDEQLYFEHKNGPVPVEVKWKEEDLRKDQIALLQKYNGFSVSFAGDLKKKHNVPNRILRVDHIQEWFAKNSDRLMTDSLMKASGLDQRLFHQKRYWVVFLNGGALLNFNRMIRHCDKRKIKFWAFKQKEKTAADILSLQKEDQILFVVAKVVGGGQCISLKKKLVCDVTGIVDGCISDPYFNLLEGEQAIFFETLGGKPAPPINKREWPHFMEFTANDIIYPDNPLKNIDLNDLKTVLADSCNKGGMPVEVTERKWREIKKRLFELRERHD